MDNDFATGYALGSDSAENKGCCNSGGMWGESWLFIIVILALFGGGFGGGFGNGNGALTRGELCQDMNFSDLQNAVRSGVAESNANFRTIDNAVCTLGYQTAQLANGVQMQMANGFSALDTSLCQLGNNVAQQFNATQALIAQNGYEGRYDALQNTYNLSRQIGDGFCGVDKDFMQSRFDSQQNTCATLQAIDKLGDRIIGQISQDKYDALARENAELRTLANNAALVSQLRPCPVPSYTTCNPWATQASYGSCGCTGCGC